MEEVARVVNRDVDGRIGIRVFRMQRPPNLDDLRINIHNVHMFRTTAERRCSVISTAAAYDQHPVEGPVELTDSEIHVAPKAENRIARYCLIGEVHGILVKIIVHPKVKRHLEGQLFGVATQVIRMIVRIRRIVFCRYDLQFVVRRPNSATIKVPHHQHEQGRDDGPNAPG